MYEFIKHKRESGEHSKEDIQLIVNSFIDGSVPDYQISAWLMAVYLNGMTNLETAFYTQSLTNSGKEHLTEKTYLGIHKDQILF